MQLSVSATVPAGCSTVMTADVNARSVMTSVQPLLGQSGAPGIGLGVGAFVVRENDALPFLIAPAGIDCGFADTATGAGFCRGAWCCPWLVQVAIGFAVALMST